MEGRRLNLTSLLLIITILVIPLIIAGCSGGGGNLGPPTGPGEQKPSKELKIESTLYGLAVASDRENFAKEHDIFLSEGKARVFILFEPASLSSEREKLIENYSIVVEKSSNDLLRALVPIDKLIPLSKESIIWSIRLPDRPIKQ